jgi:hypothetical protein
MSHFSFSRSLYDDCNLTKRNQEATSSFNWVTDSAVIESNESCFMYQASPFMHNNFKSIPSETVDVESELRNQTRGLSKCPDHKYNPQTAKKLNFKWKECGDIGLVPEYTRIDKPCNLFSGITINRFHPLCDDLQNLNNIHSNTYIGSNTRLQVKDTYKDKNNTKKQTMTTDIEHDATTPCMVNGAQCAFVKVNLN